MSALTDAIDAFLAKYPDDATLEWQKPRKPHPSLEVMVADLVQAGERHRAALAEPTPEDTV